MIVYIIANKENIHHFICNIYNKNKKKQAIFFEEEKNLADSKWA